MNLRLQRLVRGLVVAFAVLLPVAATAAPITKELTINVYQVCDDTGGNCASLGPAGNSFFEAETALIWEQAGIGVDFLFVGQVFSTRFSYINQDVVGDTFGDLYNTLHRSSPYTTVEMYLIHSVYGAYGIGFVGGGGIAISMDLVVPQNRIDTVAHELGHNFDLPHSEDAHREYLMAQGGSVRTPATSIADIYPNGLGRDRITDAQAAIARRSGLLDDVPTPEPVSMALAASGLVALAIFRRRTTRLP